MINEETFREKNTRRLELIEKLHTGFSEEERRRPFATQRDWREECERRWMENLTEAERQELAELQEWIFDCLDRR